MINFPIAVSYTHLDVYKRQVWPQPLHSSAGLFQTLTDLFIIAEIKSGIWCAFHILSAFIRAFHWRLSLIHISL